MKKIDAFVIFSDLEQVSKTVDELHNSECVNKIYLLKPKSVDGNIKRCKTIDIDILESSSTIKNIALRSRNDYTLIYLKPTALKLGYFALERMINVADDTSASMVYSDYYEISNGNKKQHPVIDYQQGSLRDDFNFGSVLLLNTKLLKRAARRMKTNEYKHAGLYDLRLKLSQKGEFVHINEYLYTEIEQDTRDSGKKIFDYVDPKNREVQIEMEKACTKHLKDIGCYLEPKFESVNFNLIDFEYEATVIIPVKNRIKTIKDAISSVLRQKTNFRFNLIVVDNYSTDGTTEAINDFSEDLRLIHVIPDRDDLGIGGCWNFGVHHPKCGKFTVQLDSDDMYSGDDTLQKIVDAFYLQNCAMVVGTYQMTNFDLEPIPPGIIDHREWTSDNGRNNALRINGLGAPRAFYTPILREVKLPNTS